MDTKVLDKASVMGLASWLAWVTVTGLVAPKA
jgi:hypothetical protein